MIAGSRFVQGVTGHFLIRAPEWAMVYFMVGFGFQLALPTPTFPTSHAYDLMAKVMPEEVWATLTIGVGCCRLVALVLNGTYRHSRKWSPLFRSVTAFVSSGVWFIILLGVWIANPVSTGVTNYLGFFTIDLTLSIMIAKPAGMAMRGHCGR